MLKSFDGQVVLITGASSGIGAALARQFADNGAFTVLVARRLDRIEALAAELTKMGRQSLAIAGDVTSDGDVESSVARAVSELGRIDAVVANAGILIKGGIARLALDDYRKLLETNTLGALRMVKATLPQLQKTKGRVVFVGSLFGMLSVPEFTAYCMSKFALNALAEGLSYELAPAGISVTQVMCGYVETEIYDRAPLRRTPPKWMALTADEAARQIVSAAHLRQRCRIIPWPAKLAVLLQRYAPGLVHLAIQRAMGKATA